jgi:hypothetical protein
MNTYKVFSVEGKNLRFTGNLISSLKSGQIETARGTVWFELNAYDRKPNHFVITISLKRSDSVIEEVFDFYNTTSVTATEDFLYDFDPSVILPKVSLATAGPRQKSAIVAVDHAYYAAARRLIRELNDHAARQQGLHGNSEPPSQLASSSNVSHRNAKIVNRIRDLFGI